MPFNAPARVPHTLPRRPCDEKSRFDYINPCSSQLNYRVNFTRTAAVAQHYSLTEDGGPLDGRRRRCTGMHVNDHRMCRYCIAATEDQKWFRKAYDYIATNNPPTGGSESNRSSHYLTRMCRLCEYREEILLAQLGGRPPNAPNVPIPPWIVPLQNHPTQAELDWSSSWPSNRCTCEKKGLYNGILCLPHRKKHWEDFKKQNDVKRRHNRNYLINTERDGNGNRVNVTPQTIARRRPNLLRRLHRACRCGEDPVDTLAEATVMQCMACEGIVHLPFRPGGTQPVFLTPPNPLPTPLALLPNSLTTPDELSIAVGWGDRRRPND